MKKIPLVALLLIAVAGLLYFWFRATAQAPLAHLFEIHGDVRVRCGDGGWTPVAAERDVEQGCAVSAQAASSAKLKLPDGSVIEIHSLSEVNVEILRSVGDALEATLRLVTGALNASVPVRTPVAHLAVTTVTATIGIRGTIFRVRYDPREQRTAVTVEEGKVEVKPANTALPSVVLEANQHVEVTTDRVSPVVKIPPGFTYLGCYKDQGDPGGTTGRDMPGAIYSDPGMTTSMCVERCRSGGFAYAGTQYSSYCFCGNSYGGSGRAGNCNMPCAGNREETCGGAWANSIYQTGVAPAPQPPAPASTAKQQAGPGDRIAAAPQPAPPLGPTLQPEAPISAEPAVSARTFAGTWTTDWGNMRLRQSGTHLEGDYDHEQGRITGEVAGNVLTGAWSEAPSYQPPQDGGELQFTLSADGNSWTSRWRYGSTGEWRTNWNGTRKQTTGTQAGGLEHDIDRPGMDISSFDLPAAQPELCRQSCLNDPNCVAFTYVKPGVQGPAARCWLKNAVPQAVASTCCVSGVK